jgi:hypothetical protein
MQLRCPRCRRPIAAEFSNVAEGKAYCGSCHRYFRIAPVLSSAEEVRRVRKRHDFGTKMTRDGATTTFDIYKEISVGIVFFPLFLVFAILIPFFTKESLPAMQIVAGVLVPFVVIWILWELKGQRLLVITPETIYLKRKLYRYESSEVRQRDQFDEVFEDVEFDSYGAATYYVRMKFKNSTSLIFGKQLTHSERVWLIGEIAAAIHPPQS